MELYDSLADWWLVISPPSEYVEEGSLYIDMIQGAAYSSGLGPVRKMLKLGCGDVNKTSYMNQAFSTTLVELAGRIREVSRKFHPVCTHLFCIESESFISHSGAKDGSCLRKKRR